MSHCVTLWPPGLWKGPLHLVIVHWTPLPGILTIPGPGNACHTMENSVTLMSHWKTASHWCHTNVKLLWQPVKIEENYSIFIFSSFSQQIMRISISELKPWKMVVWATWNGKTVQVKPLNSSKNWSENERKKKKHCWECFYRCYHQISTEFQFRI